MDIEAIMKNKIEPLQLPTKFINKIKHDLEYIISNPIEGLEQVILFGSCATGKIKATSDVDWMLVTREPIINREIRHTLLCDICEEYQGVESDLVLTTLEAIRQKNTKFMQIVSNHQIVIWSL